MAWGSTGTTVDMSKQAASTILFALSGQNTIRQWESVTTSEVRGIQESTAKSGVPSSASDVTSLDSTTQTHYWAHIGGRTYSITVTTGTKTEKGAARKDDSGQWVRTDTVHTFFVTGLNTNVWGTTELDADGNAVTLTSGGTEVTVGYDRTTSRVAWDVYSVVTTTVKEFRNIDSLAHAQTIVNNNSSSGQGTSTIGYFQRLTPSSQDYIAYSWVIVPSGTDKFASARYGGAQQGWTVTATIKTYTWSSPRAAASGTGWRVIT